MPSYELHLYSPQGAYTKTVTKRITRLDWHSKLGDVGSFGLTFSDRMQPVDTSLFALNSRIAIWRKASPFDTARLEMIGFVRDWQYKTDNRGVTRYLFAGVDQNFLLKSRICYPAVISGTRDGVHDYIDTIMRLLVEYNLGASGSNAAARDLVTSNTAGLTVAIESSATATACGTAKHLEFDHRGRNLLEALQQLHHTSKTYMGVFGDLGTAAVRCWFNMCADSDTALTFRVRGTRWGVNHRADSANHVPLGVSFGNLREPEWRHDRQNEITAAMAISPTDWPAYWYWHTDRDNDAPLNRREAFVWTDALEENDHDAHQLLNEGKSKPEFRGMVSDTPGCRYGVHWGLGDELTADHVGQQYNVIMTELRCQYAAGRERLEPVMEVQE